MCHLRVVARLVLVLDLARLNARNELCLDIGYGVVAQIPFIDHALGVDAVFPDAARLKVLQLLIQRFQLVLSIQVPVELG